MQRPLQFDGRSPDPEVSLMASSSWLRALSSWTRKSSPLRRARPRARLGVETLEDRTVPSTFTYQATGTAPVSLVLTNNNQSIQVRDGNTNAVLASAPLATTTAVQITGAAAATSLTVAEIPPLKTLPISFAGQSGSDTIESVVATKQTFTVTGLNSGTVGNISYSGVNNILGGGGGVTTFKFLPGGSDHALDGNGAGVLDLSAFTLGTTVTLPYNANSGFFPLGFFSAGGPNGAPTTAFIDVQTIIGAKNDTLVGPVKANVWNISGANSGTVDDGITFSNFPNLQGGGVSDSFQFTTNVGNPFAAGIVSGNIAGGGGVATLDYSGYKGSIVVDLPLGFASLVAGSVSNIQNVVGSIGSDILVGTGGNTLIGGSSASLLIAGPTPSILHGLGGEDILVGGTTAYDKNITALNAIMAEWARTGLSSQNDPTGYLARVNHLLHGGGFNRNTVLTRSTFSTNGGHNTLDGGAGLDLFYGFQTLETTDYNPGLGEIFINDATFGHTRIDVNNLSFPPVLDSSQVLSNGFSPYLTLSPGTHTLTQELTNNSVQFTVAADGTVNYDPSLNGVLSGRGTTTLVVNGVTVAVDATALQASVPSLTLDPASAIEPTNAPFTITVLPGPHAFAQPFTNDVVQFTVAADGTISYDASLQGVLTTSGPNMLTIHGVTVTVDATALQASVPSLILDPASVIEPTNAPFTITVLPGPHASPSPSPTTWCSSLSPLMAPSATMRPCKASSPAMAPTP
jgi:hypothetical protein